MIFGGKEAPRVSQETAAGGDTGYTMGTMGKQSEADAAADSVPGYTMGKQSEADATQASAIFGGREAPLVPQETAAGKQ